VLIDWRQRAGAAVRVTWLTQGVLWVWDALNVT
jgi:hypothetical protein